MLQWKLFVAFFRCGILGYGGGPASIPLVRVEVVERYGWMNDDEFGDVLAIGNTLPGPIITKMAGYIGYRVGGFVGMLNAILAITLPTIVLVIVLLTTLANFQDLAWVRGMTKAVIPVVAVMLGSLAWGFLKSSYTGLKWLYTGIHIVVGLVLIAYFGLHPAWVIGTLLLFALFKPTTKSPSKAGDT